VRVQRERLGWPAAILLLAACVLAGCGGGGGGDGAQASSDSGSAVASAEGSGAEGETDSTAAPKPKRKKPISVNVAEVTRDRLVHSVLAEGRLRARKQTEIKTELSGKLDRLLVDEGEAVRADQLIAVLDQREDRAALGEARARHLPALSELAVNLELKQSGEVDQSALADYQVRVNKLRDDFKSGRVDHDEFAARSLELELSALKEGAFRRDVLEARTGFAEAHAAEERALLNLERTEIIAPFPGTITGLDLVRGERVTAGQILCRLVNTRDLEAEVYVLESDLGSLQVDYPALLTITAVEQTLPVRVNVVSPDVDVISRTCRVLFRFQNDSRCIRPGMFVRAEIATQMIEGCLLVPKEAVLVRDKRDLVFKVDEDNRAIWIYVDTGLRNEHYVEITGVAAGQTLEAGDRVVVSDHLTLAHEAAVKVRKTVTPDDPWRTHFAPEEG
jgi:multidrug efflux pump subunit AcrA (membrane-fusion protein)